MNIRIILIFIILLISSSIVLEMPAPSFVSMEKFFNVSEVTIGYIVSLSLVGSFFASFLYGPLADFYGRKKILIFGNFIALIGSIGCVFSQSIEALIFSRFVQGFGASCSLVLIPIIISDLYEVNEASKLYKINAAFVTIFTAMAPIIGGFANDKFGWRYNFQIIMYFSILAFLFSYYFKETKKSEVKKISFNNIFLEYKFLLKDHLFLLSSLATNLLYGNFLVFLTYTPFLYIKVFGMTASNYSIHQAVAVIAFSIANFALSRFSESMNLRFVKIGICLCVFSTISIYFFNSPNFITFFICLSAMGSAMTFPTLMAYSIGNVEESLKGAGSSFSIGTRYLICGFIIYIVSKGYDETNTRLSVFMSTLSLIIFSITLYLFKKRFFDKKDIPVELK